MQNFIGLICKKNSMCSIFDENGNFIPVTKINYKKNIEIKKDQILNLKFKVVSFSKGKGFCGVIKRHNFKSNRKTHGNSKSHNKPGSIGMCQDPGKVFKGKKMAGRMGFKKVTVKNVTIKKIDFKNRILYVFGSLPGKKNTIINLFPI